MLCGAALQATDADHNIGGWIHRLSCPFTSLLGYHTWLTTVFLPIVHENGPSPLLDTIGATPYWIWTSPREGSGAACVTLLESAGASSMKWLPSLPGVGQACP